MLQDKSLTAQHSQGTTCGNTVRSPTAISPRFVVGFLTPLSAFSVTDGVMFGETLTSIDEIVCGDSIRLLHNDTSQAVGFTDHSGPEVVTPSKPIRFANGAVSALGVGSLTLMSEYGHAVHMRLLANLEHDTGAAWLLHSARLDASDEYVIISIASE